MLKKIQKKVDYYYFIWKDDEKNKDMQNTHGISSGVYTADDWRFWFCLFVALCNKIILIILN